MKTLAALFLASFAVLSWPNAAEAQLRHVPGVRVRVAPPASRLEAAPLAPSPRHLWIAGYWAWHGGTHVWMGGHWALPPQPSYVWEPARWENVGGAWMFYEGHWRTADIPVQEEVYQPPAPPAVEVVVGTPPPAPIEEIRPAPPFMGALWIPGYWHWQGIRHIWVGGRWSAPAAGHAWEAHRWEKRPDGNWAQRPGHWHPR
jgi:hypothetical protein